MLDTIALARTMRQEIIKMLTASASGHPGGSLSATDFLAVLYGEFMNVDPAEPRKADRDRFVLTKGHAAPALYAILALKGFFPMEELANLRKLGSPLQGHPDMHKVPGVDASTGSLGQGLSLACGMALAAKMDGQDYRVYALMGDGEQQEGQVWEAAMFAAAKKLTNLVWLIDWNKKQLDGYTCDVLDTFNLEEKFRAFGFDACTIDGNDVVQLHTALTKEPNGKPLAIIMDTLKGKGVTEIEEAMANHSMNVSAEVFDRWLAQLQTDLAALEA